MFVCLCLKKECNEYFVKLSITLKFAYIYNKVYI